MARVIQVDERLSRASTIPSGCYTDPASLAVERDRIFARTWQLVGREDQVDAVGSYFTAEVAGEPLLVVRASDGRLRALSNVCRHRAGPVAKGEGSCGAFRCGYHGWSYALDGQLANTPGFDGVEDFERTSVRLPDFRVETWLGLVFVNLDREAASLLEMLGGLPAKLEARELSRMGLAARKDWEIDCNWKVYVDNYLEGYHIPIVHPGLMKEIDYSRYETETSGRWSLQHSPIRPREDARLRRDARQSESDAEYYWVYPNLMLNVYPDNFSTNLIVPLSPRRTLTVFEWFFPDPGRPSVQETVRQTIEFSDEIQREDIAICEAVQKGLESRTYDVGRFSVKRESGVHHFHRLYASALSP
ncbi:MAG TPA: SRPBCC family protein [Thermoanaerobaculia bacterium]|nr:SRPBCC family protein [Thermoanaerobaculia bacterium]